MYFPRIWKTSMTSVVCFAKTDGCKGFRYMVQPQGRAAPSGDDVGACAGVGAGAGAGADIRS